MIVTTLDVLVNTFLTLINFVMSNNMARHHHKKPKLGTGKRFVALRKKLAGRKGVYDPSGLAAHIGRKKFGKTRFQKLAASGKHRKY